VPHWELWIERMPNYPNFKTTIRQVWKPLRCLDIDQIEKIIPHTILSLEYEQKVFEQGPWNFDKQVLVLKKLWQIVLFKNLLRVRAYDVP
jgi:hypothetical protein